MANNMASSDQWENAILTKSGTVGFVKRGTWCQDVRHKIGDVADTICRLPALLVGWCCRTCQVGLVDLGENLFEVEVRDV